MAVEDVLIRRLKMDDVDDIIRIFKAITQEEITVDFKKVLEEQSQKTEDASFVAEQQSRVVGYMIGYLLSGSFGTEKSAWIAMLGVDPKFMGQGIGKSLAKEIFRFYKDRDITNIYTSVRWDSTDLLSFFKTLGFDRSNFINLRKNLD
jgi:ribosomal protein S18 acetylase RimI-like enzyme